MHYSKIKHFDPANGPGIRLSLFVSGCKFHCYNCFNPETWDFKYGQLYTRQDTEKHILEELSSPNYDGLSILGGDPLWQLWPDIQDLIFLVKKVKQLNKTVWIWSGFTWEEIFNPKYEDCINKENTYLFRQDLIKACDVWVDGRYEDSLKDIRLPYCGSTNQRVIDVQATLKNPTGEVILYEGK